MFPKPKAPKSGGVQWKGSSLESGSWLGSATHRLHVFVPVNSLESHFPPTFKGSLVSILKGPFKFLYNVNKGVRQNEISMLL